MGQLFTFGKSFKSRSKRVETDIESDDTILKPKEVEDGKDCIVAKTGIQNKNADNLDTSKEVHRPQKNELEFCVNNLPHQCSKRVYIHFLPVVVDNLDCLPVGSDSRQSVHQLRILTIDGDDQFTVHFVDPDTECKVVHEEVDCDCNDDYQE